MMKSTSATPARAAIYHRVSTLDQCQTAARHELRAAVTARGMTVALEVEETGSGAKNSRPGLQQILEAARRHKIDAVLVWKLDRFGRSAHDLLINIRTLEDAGVRFIAVTQGIDLKPGGDPMSRLILTVLSGVAEFERSLIVERVRLGMAKAKREGKPVGRRVSADAPDSRLVAELRASGASWRQVADRLHCTPSAARRAVERLAGKSRRSTAAGSVENASAQ